MKYKGTIAYRAGLGGNVPEGFVASIVQAWDFLLRNFRKDEHQLAAPPFHFMRGLSCMLHDSANQIADGFLGDWVLMLDTDHVFQSDAFYEMANAFEEGGLDILVGFAQKRQHPYTPLIYRTGFNPFLPFEPIIPKGVDRQILIPIDAAGCACLMVRRRVFDAMKTAGERPFDFRKKFNSTWIGRKDLWTDGVVIKGMNDLPADRYMEEFYWEDISFFWRAKMLGFKAWCAPWIKFHHIETRLVTEHMMVLPENAVIPQ